MISLFETTQKEEAPTFRDVYLKRLHEIAYAPNGRPSEAAAATATDPAVEAPPPETDSAEAVAVVEIETTPEPPRGEMKVETQSEAMTLDSRKLAEEIALKFVDAFVVAFDEMERHASGSNGRVSGKRRRPGAACSHERLSTTGFCIHDLGSLD